MEQAQLTEPATPRGWAARLTTLLNARSANGGPARFPVSAGWLAAEFSQQRYPAEPISRVDGDDLRGFEGCLMPFGDGSGQWGIVYNNRASEGRVRFTIAHELGHYLLHRKGAARRGISCSVRDVSGGHPGQKAIEREADEFAAWLLMPFDDLRRQVPPDSRPDLHRLSEVADRYGTSLLSTCLRWLECTSRRAVLVVSRDGFIDWARSSEAALRTGAFFRPRSGPPIELPPASLAANPGSVSDPKSGMRHAAGVWFDTATVEMAVVADAYDFTMSLLMLGDPPDRDWSTFGDRDQVAVPVDERFGQGWAR